MADFIWLVSLERTSSMLEIVLIGNLRFVMSRSSAGVKVFQLTLRLGNDDEVEIAEAKTVSRIGLWSNN